MLFNAIVMFIMEGGGDMLFNAIVMFIICAILGTVANVALRVRNGLFFNAFTGLMGMAVADVAVRFAGRTPRLAMSIALYVAGGFVAAAGIRAVRELLGGPWKPWKRAGGRKAGET